MTLLFKSGRYALSQSTASLSLFGWAKRIVAALGVSVLVSNAQAMADQAMPQVKTGVHNIILVHGAMTDGSSWSPIISRLQALGYHVTAVQNPLTSLAEDVATTERALRRQDGDVLLVGHSWGGVVITQAGNAPNVKGLVYLSALAPDSGESMDDLLKRLGAPMTAASPDADGFIRIDDSNAFHQFMAADLPIKKVKEIVAAQQPIAVSTMAEKVTHAAWHDKPSWYLQAQDDQAIRPEIQKTMAQQLGAKITSIRSSHMSYLSHPDAVVKLIDQAAQNLGN